MVYFVSPRRIITRPSTFYLAIERGKKIEDLFPLLEERRNLIFVDPRQLTILSSHPKNLKKSFKTRDPLAPFSLSLKILLHYLRKFKIKDSYIIFPNYLDYEGLLLIDPSSGPIGYYSPYSNIGGISSDIPKFILERNKRKEEWYKKQGIEDIRFPRIDVEEERKIARKTRKIVRNAISQLLEYFFEKMGEELNVFVFSGKGELYKWVFSALKKIDINLPEKILKYKNFPPGEPTISLENMVRFLNFLFSQTGKFVNLNSREIERFFPKTDLYFVFPPEFDSFSYSFNPFHLDGEILNYNKMRSSLFGFNGLLTDRERIREFLKRYFGIDKPPDNLTDLFKKLEEKLYIKIPAYEPIESLALRQVEKIGEIKPFRREIENPEVDGIVYRASLSVAPCVFERLIQFFGVEIFTEEEKRRIFFGNFYHDLILHSPGMPYLNNFIWKILGLQPVDRRKYVEREVVGRIEIKGKKYPILYHADALFEDGKEIILTDLKYSLPLPEVYKIAHAKQLQVGKLALQSRNLECAEKGILFYLISPPPSKLEDTISSSPTNRYVFFTENLENMVKFDIFEFYKTLNFVCQPGSIKENVEKIFREHEKESCVCSKHELIEERKEELIRKIKTRLN